MNNPESGKKNQVNVGKEHAILDQEFANLKKEQEDLLKELKNGSNEDLLERFKILQKKLEELRVRVEMWKNENKDVVFPGLKEKLMETRKIYVREIAEMIYVYYGKSDPIKLIYETFIARDAVRALELVGDEEKYMRGIGGREYSIQQLGAIRFFDAFFFDQGVEKPTFSLENLVLFSPHKVSVSEVARYSRFFSKSNNSEDFFRSSSFADYFYSQYKNEYYLPGMDALLFILADKSEADMEYARDSFAKKLLDLVAEKYGTEISSLSPINFIFPGFTVLDFQGKFVFPVLSYNVMVNNFSFAVSDISKTVSKNDIFVLFHR